MGIRRLDKLVHLASLRSGLARLASGDVGVQAASLRGGLYDRCTKVAKSLRTTWSVTPKDLVRANHLNRMQESKDWDNLASRQGVRDFRKRLALTSDRVVL
jgi:hypothetical protein